MSRCWACRQEIPVEHSYSLFIRERRRPGDMTLGVVICLECHLKVLKCLEAIQDAATEEQGT